MDVAVVGGGVTGLAATHYLAERGVDAVAFEADDQPGGVVQSRRVDGRVVEVGPQRMRRTPAVGDLVEAVGLAGDIVEADEGTELVFSAHGTPVHYLEEGSRYDIYVDEFCSVVASLLGVTDYHIGYQNHGNRDIPWTEPEVDDLVSGLDAERVVVEPVSFLHEQSETLSELDIELREDAIDEGQTMYRVPIPHDDERIGDIFADLVEPLVTGFDPGYYQLRQCQCRDEPGTVCLNAPR